MGACGELAGSLRRRRKLPATGRASGDFDVGHAGHVGHVGGWYGASAAECSAAVSRPRVSGAGRVLAAESPAASASVRYSGGLGAQGRAGVVRKTSTRRSSFADRRRSTRPGLRAAERGERVPSRAPAPPPVPRRCAAGPPERERHEVLRVVSPKLLEQGAVDRGGRPRRRVHREADLSVKAGCFRAGSARLFWRGHGSTVATIKFTQLGRAQLNRRCTEAAAEVPHVAGRRRRVGPVRRGVPASAGKGGNSARRAAPESEAATDGAADRGGQSRGSRGRGAS